MIPHTNKERATMPPEPTKYEAAAQPGLFFWAERVGGPIQFWAVVSQADGYPASEAHDDWFANQEDADRIAQEFARDYPNH